MTTFTLSQQTAIIERLCGLHGADIPSVVLTCLYCHESLGDNGRDWCDGTDCQDRWLVEDEYLGRPDDHYYDDYELY
jgi:hypothetical protein